MSILVNLKMDPSYVWYGANFFQLKQFVVGVPDDDELKLIINEILERFKNQSWASPQVSPQIRNCGLTKKVADMRTCGLWQFKLRTCGCGLFLILVRNSASFIQILKFLYKIFRKIFMFLPSQT